MMGNRLGRIVAALLVGIGLGGAPARAEINVGLTLSITGPAAALGIPERNTVALLPKSIAGEKVNYIVLDDATDVATALANTRRLLASRVDVIVGSSTTPTAMAMIDAVAAAETPMLALAAGVRLVAPLDSRRAWVFTTPRSEAPMAQAIARHMRAKRISRVAFIGFADACGDGWWAAFSAAAEAHELALTTRQVFQSTDTEADTAVARILATRPDAVFVAAAGTPAALPHKTLRARGYSGPIYQTHGAASPDFLRVGGKDVEGTVLVAGPVLVAGQLPKDDAVARAARDYVQRYEARFGSGSVSAFGAYLWDAGLLLQSAIPAARRQAAPGTPAFRRALREALEDVRDLAGANGFFNFGAGDPHGADPRSWVLVTVEQGRWKLIR